MSSSDRRASLSPSERQRTKSRSSSRSHRTPPKVTVHDEDTQREKTSSQTSKRNTRETNPTKRSESSTSNRSANGVSPTSNTSKKQRSNIKTPTSTSSKSKSPTSNRKSGLKRKKSLISISDADNKQLSPPNDSERQDLSTRGLSVVPGEIFELITLRRLILSNNNISSLPSNMRSLINLEYLDISRNPLRVKNGLDDYSCIPREFRYLRNLQTLIMAECTLKHIPVTVWNLLSLQTLDISRNKIGFIVGEIGNLIDIRHLRLSQMDLDTLPPEIGFCDKLQTIDLTGNPIDNLPETLVECRQLYELKLNYKTFSKLLDNYMLQLIDEGKIHSEHIPQVIFELENLNILDLNQTKLNFIPNQHTLIHLQELYLSNNSFFDIPESICTMEQLKILDISNNRLQNIPEYFIQVKQLEILILSYNNLTSLSKIFSRLSTLKKLIVSHNQINTIENGFSQSRSLLTLDISYNNLKLIPDELCDLKQLETLDLRYNQLEYLPLSIRRMIGLKSMNTFDENFQRIGLHISGNLIIDPPSYIWKSTNIQTLFDYIETKEKILSKNFYHLKLILIGPKNIGKTTLTIKLLNNQKLILNTQTTLDMYVSILEKNQLKNNQEEEQQQKLSDITSSVLTDQWIENRISTNGDHLLNPILKIKRTYPPPLKTYRTNELFESILNKSIFLTKNNLYCTIFDLTSEPSFEILYPLIYDSNALFILPINLTILLNIVQAATILENMNENENHLTLIDFDALLTDDWLYCHIFRYIESISDHCQQTSIAIIGLLNNSQIKTSNDQQLLNEIHSKVNSFLLNEENQRKNINLYSEFFPEPIYLDNEQISSIIIEQLEIIAQQWNFIHHKQKRQILKQRLGLIQQDSLIIDYNTFLKHFEQQNQFLSISSEDDDDDDENKELIEKEINEMNLNACLDYLKLTGDILCFGQIPQMKIIVQPYYLLNNILSRTLFRSHIDQWLNYDDNLIFHFSGYYLTQELFDIDRERLLTRGEYTWNMLQVLFYEQNINNNKNLIEENIRNYCHLMEQLYLGYLNQSNLNYREFTTISFVCPWLMNEKLFNIDYMNYFKLLEQNRSYEQLQREQSRRIKQQQIWFAMDNEQDYIQNENLLQTNIINYSVKQKPQQIQIMIDDLPSIDQIEILDSQIINQNSIQLIKINNKYSNFLPNGFYERLLICLHPLFYERLDYYNITLGRTVEKNLIQIQRFDNDNQIYITINNCLLEHIKNILIYNLFSFYPTINFQIET